MSDGMNKVFLLGNLGTEPELRYSSGGTAVMHFRMATNESFLDRNRDLTERTEWHSVVMFGSRAEGIARVLTKGTCVLVEGTLRTSSYEKDGVKRYRTEIHARDIRFTGSGPRMPDISPSLREPDESFVPEEMTPLPEESPVVIDERPAASTTRSHRSRRGAASAHRMPVHEVEPYPH
ncbi:MAG: single-stranded DNA-binding protein [Polyangiaceae bacterium]|nr:single-stranded DNA-binding protein [Polyangiaceae bacterium]